jgi:hypothetical protein
MKLEAALVALATYLLAATVLFGDALQPIALITLWSDRLGAPNWELLVAGSFVIGAIVAAGVSQLMKRAEVAAATFVSVSMGLSVASVVLYADRLRQTEFRRLQPDVQMQHSLLRSLREAPAEFQFYLHAAAVKACVPYGWSYRTMSFYQLPPEVVGNVLPREWLRQCSRLRTQLGLAEARDC